MRAQAAKARDDLRAHAAGIASERGETSAPACAWPEWGAAAIQAQVDRLRNGLRPLSKAAGVARFALELACS